MPGDLTPLNFLRFIYSQLLVRLPDPTTSFAGKTVIITGANTGLGLEAARKITTLGAAKLIIAVRSTDKGESAKKSIVASTGCAPSTIDVWPLDLCSYDSVKTFAARASRDLARVDVFLQNAGVATGEFRLEEGNELTLTTNVVSTLLLAFLLLPKMRETAARHNTRPVMSVVASEVHAHVDFPEAEAPEGIFAHMNDSSKADMATRYPTSKLMLVFLLRELTTRLPAQSCPVTINMLNPGLCQSELSREGDVGVRISKFFLARTAEYGSRTLVSAACAGAETHGEYLSDCKVAEQASITRSEYGQRAQRRLWAELVDKVEGIQAGVTGGI